MATVLKSLTFAHVAAKVKLTLAWIGLSRPAIDRQHESTRVLAPAGDSEMCVYCIPAVGIARNLQLSMIPHFYSRYIIAGLPHKAL